MSDSCSTSFFSRFSERDTGVTCHVCGDRTLHTRFTCFDAEFYCHGCERYYSLSELFRKISDDDFTALAEMVSERNSDRI